jgi:hypothetical protein
MKFALEMGEGRDGFVRRFDRVWLENLTSRRLSEGNARPPQKSIDHFPRLITMLMPHRVARRKRLVLCLCAIMSRPCNTSVVI